MYIYDFYLYGNLQFTYTTDIQLSEDEKKTESYNLRERKQSSYKDSFDVSIWNNNMCLSVQDI